jgi:hypothetical protein
MVTQARANSRFLHADGIEDDYKAMIADIYYQNIPDIPATIVWTESGSVFFSLAGWDLHVGTL